MYATSYALNVVLVDTVLKTAVRTSKSTYLFSFFLSGGGSDTVRKFNKATYLLYSPVPHNASAGHF